MMHLKEGRGFTLLELVISLVIIGILAAVAVPSYFTYIMKSRRVEGIDTLNTIQMQEEKYRGYNATYGTLANVWGGVTTTSNGYYALAINNPTTTGYTITATAQGQQANDTQNGTSCSVLTLTVNNMVTTHTPAICWSQ